MTESRTPGHTVQENMRFAGTETPSQRQFCEIYQDNFKFVWAVARRFGVPPAALEDVVQEVFITAFRRIDRLSHEVSLRAWLYAVTRKIASQQRRGAARLARRLAALEAVSPGAAEVPQERHDAAQMLDHLLKPLPRGTREVWEMTEFLGMTGPEIAAELDLPLNTVYSRLRLARGQLAAHPGGSETVSAAVEATKAHQDPPPDAAQRGWTVLLPALQPGSFTGIAAAWVSTRGAIATTMIVAGAVTVIPVVIMRPPATPHAAAVRPPPAPAPVAASSPVLPRIAAEPLAAPPQHRPAIESKVAPQDAEIALIDAAHRLSASEPAAALVLLAEHAQKFPDSVLHLTREAVRVDALCRVGDSAAATAIARRISSQQRDAVLAQRFQDYVCVP